MKYYSRSPRTTPPSFTNWTNNNESPLFHKMEAYLHGWTYIHVEKKRKRVASIMLVAGGGIAIKYTRNISIKICRWCMKNDCSLVGREMFVAKGWWNRAGNRVFLARFSPRVADDRFVCVYQNTHLIIPRIAVGAESGYPVLAYSALNSHLEPWRTD